ncbi:MAG: antibiotic biosynthesis monooxygenase family protein [Brevundimonas sp.]
MTVVLINPFIVFDGREAEFLELWDQTQAIFSSKPGYRSARLVRARAEQPPGERAPFTHVNVAYWDAAEAYAQALTDPDLRRLGGRYLKVCTFNPALYDIVRDV